MKAWKYVVEQEDESPYVTLCIHPIRDEFRYAPGTQEIEGQFFTTEELEAFARECFDQGAGEAGLYLTSDKFIEELKKQVKL